MSDRDNSQDDHADALAAMAEGRDVEPEDDSPEDDAPPAEAALTETEPAEPMPGPVATPVDAQQLRRRQAAANRKAAQADAHAFKKTMTPILVVLAVIFGILGVAGFVMAAGADLGLGTMAGKARMSCLAMGLLGLPLAAMAVGAAWWFHRETSGR